MTNEQEKRIERREKEFVHDQWRKYLASHHCISLQQTVHDSYVGEGVCSQRLGRDQ